MHGAIKPPEGIPKCNAPSLAYAPRWALAVSASHVNVYASMCLSLTHIDIARDTSTPTHAIKPHLHMFVTWRLGVSES